MSDLELSDLWPAPTPSGPVHAQVVLPGSKSLTNRALILAAISDGPSGVRGALASRDTSLMAAALTALGASVDTSGPDWMVAPGELRGPATIDCGLAGTVMRFVPPIAALATGDARFDGDPHARTRPMESVLQALRELGVQVTGDRLPFTVHGTGAVAGGVVEIDASASSQFISALLLAGPRYKQGIEVRHVGERLPSFPHIEMTLEALRNHQVVTESGESCWRVLPGIVAATDITIEPDLSNAAPFLAIAAVTKGTVTVPRWPQRTTQAGDALREILTRMGATVTLDNSGLTVTGGDLVGVDLDLHDVGELAPALAALCALADGPSTLRGIAHIRGHETDRLTGLATELNALGGEVTETADGLHINPRPLTGGVFHTYADHRMAHAGVILGLGVEGVLIENIATTGKTFTEFDQAWSAAVTEA